jgi:hypothetical protein
MNELRRIISYIFCSIGIIIISNGCAELWKYNTSILENKDIQLHVDIFTNKTLRYGLERMLTNMIIEELIYTGDIDIVDKSDANLNLKGSIIEYKRFPIAYGEDYVDKYRVMIKVKIKIIETLHNNMIFEDTVEEFIDYIPQYSSLVDKGLDYMEEDEALHELCERIAYRAGYIVSSKIGEYLHAQQP